MPRRSGDAATLQDIIEACDAEHRRLGGDLANATDEDVRLFALFSTAAVFPVPLDLEHVPPARADDALVSRVVRRVWLHSARGERVGYGWSSIDRIDRSRTARDTR